MSMMSCWKYFFDYEHEAVDGVHWLWLWLNYGLDNYWHYGCVPNEWDYTSKKKKDDDVLVHDYEQADNGNDVQVGLRAWWCSLARSWITTSPTPSSQRKGQPHYQTKPLDINICSISLSSSTVYSLEPLIFPFRLFPSPKMVFKPVSKWRHNCDTERNGCTTCDMWCYTKLSHTWNTWKYTFLTPAWRVSSHI